jgi:phosphatidylglycerophosphate synthase
MTLAVVVATEPIAEGSTAGLPYDEQTAVLERLLGQLASLNVSDVQIISRPGLAAKLPADRTPILESWDLAGDLREIARLARAAAGPLVLLPADLVVNDEQLVRVLGESKAEAAAVIAPLRSARIRPLVRVEGGVVVSAGSPYHQVTDPSGEFRGVLRLDGPMRGKLADACAALAAETGELTEAQPVRILGQAGEPGVFVDNEAVAVIRALRPPEAAGAGRRPQGDDAVGLALVALVRSGGRVTVRPLRDLVCDRVLTEREAAAARRAVEAVNEDRVRLDAAVKDDDGFFTTYFVSSYSRIVARWCARLGLTPNTVTSISMAIAVLAAVWFSDGSRLGLVVGAVLLYVAFVFDCVDGQLARYTRQFSPLGAWLDATFDRAKEYVVYFGLAVGSTEAVKGTLAYGGGVWGLAVAALIVQTVRHMIDFSFVAVRARAEPAPLPVLPATDPSDAALDGRPARTGPAVVRLSARTERIPGLRKAKKIVILPIGERFALISLTAAFFNARVTFIALLVWGSLAAAYTLTGRVLRSAAL